MDDLYFEPQVFTPVADVLEELSRAWELPFPLTGGSGRGWSYYGTLERCPRAFYLRYVEEREVELSRPAREVGSIFHALAAIHYGLACPDRAWLVEPKDLRDRLLERNCEPKPVHDAWRVFEAYTCNYEEDYLEPLAVEYTVRVKGKSCRYDLIAYVAENTRGIAAGTYIVEHKTASAFTSDLLTGWDLDGEVLGQIALWEKADLSKTFGPLQGVIINIAGKQKQPQFERVIVAPRQEMSRRHLRVLNHLDGQRREFTRRKFWPQYWNGCVGRWGKCDYWTTCLTEDLR